MPSLSAVPATTVAISGSEARPSIRENLLTSRRLPTAAASDRGLHVAGQRPFERAGQRHQVGAIDQDRLADQIFCARTILLRFAAAFPTPAGQASGEARA